MLRCPPRQYRGGIITVLPLVSDAFDDTGTISLSYPNHCISALEGRFLN